MLTEHADMHKRAEGASMMNSTGWKTICDKHYR